MQSFAPGVDADRTGGQLPPLNPVRLFVGLQVGQPDGFYLGDAAFADFESDAQQAVDRAKQMVQNYRPVDFI